MIIETLQTITVFFHIWTLESNRKLNQTEENSKIRISVTHTIPSAILTNVYLIKTSKIYHYIQYEKWIEEKKQN